MVASERIRVREIMILTPATPDPAPRLCLTNNPRVYLHADSQSLTAVNGIVLSVSYLSVCDARGDASARRCWS